MADIQGLPQRITGDITAGDVDLGNPVKIGAHATEMDPALASVTPGDRSYARALTTGTLLTMGGMPGTKSIEVTRVSDDFGVSNEKIVDQTGGRILVTKATLTVSADCTRSCQFRLGFGLSVLVGQSLGGNTRMIMAHDRLPPGKVMSVGDGSGTISYGLDGFDLIYTTSRPTNGSLTLNVTYVIMNQ